MVACSVRISLGTTRPWATRIARPSPILPGTLEKTTPKRICARASADTGVDASPQWPKFLATLFTTGAIAGPLLDGIHSRVYLQTYKSLPVNIDVIDFHTSLWVPPLLGLFYMVLGTLQPILDTTIEGRESEKLTNEFSFGNIALGFAVLAAGIELSAFMYDNGYPYIQIHGALALVSLGTWWTLDGSRQGVILALISGVGGLLSELPIQYFVGWWDYAKPDVLDLCVSWTFWCYFFYTPAVGNLGRKLWRECNLGQDTK